MSHAIAPLQNHLLIELEPEREQSSVIRVVKSVEGLARFGRVLGIGPEAREVKPGMRVLASIAAGVELKDGVVMIPEDSVLAIQHQ